MAGSSRAFFIFDPKTIKRLNSESDKNAFIIYRSSAGSGKTYSLALEFISLCIADPGLFSKILAVTFTNKATREMKERIIGNLEKLAINSDPELMKDISEKTGYSDVLVIERAAKVLDNILHNYSQLSISTIDAFFQKIIKAFAKELGLMGNFSIELDQAKVMDEVIDLLIEDVGKDQELTGWLIDFSSDAVESGEAWDIRRKIKKFASELLKESNANTVSEALDYRRFLDELKKVKVRFENEMSQTAKEALAIARDHSLSIDDFSNKMSGPAGYLLKVSQKKDYTPGQRFREAVVDESKWFTKSSPLSDTIRAALHAGLMEKAGTLMKYYEDHHQAYYSAVQVIGNFYLYGILAKLSAKLQTYRQENDIMLISDVPVFLQKIISGNDAPFIYEKTGSWYRHYLIDEFQDTSGFQWNNFKPLVENGLSQGHKSLLVGDGKQSIYRWRGGDWSLILHQVEQDLIRNHIVKKDLQTNWRSEANIVQFNNSLYQLAPGLIADNLLATIEMPDAATASELYQSVEDIRKLYEGAKQDVSEKRLKNPSGAVLIKVFEKDAEQKWTELALEQLPADIERIQDLGYTAGEIAILVRRAAEGRMVIEQLLKHKNSIHARSGYTYDAVSGESLFIGKSPAVRLLVNCLKYCANPTDKLVLADIQYGHYLVRNSDSTESPDVDNILSESSLPTDFQQICITIASQPVFDMVERFIRLFELDQPNVRGYVEAFQNEVLIYFSDRTKNLNDFLAWWEDDGNLKSLAAMDSGNAIRVMTIHKSKGLEFGAVIIPFCSWKLSPEASHGSIIWCETDKAPYADRGKFPLKYASALEKTYFARDYYKEMILGNIDNLNLLYVATTRAESYLQINCPPESDKLTTSGDLVATSIQRLCESSESPLSLENFRDKFNNNCYRIVGQMNHISNQKESKNVAPMVGYTSADWRQKVQIRSGIQDIGADTMPEWKTRISYGLLIHEILADAAGQKEALAALEEWRHSNSLTEEDFSKAQAQLKRIFSNAEVSDWFHPRWLVKREAEIISGTGMSKRPDRVIIDGKKAVVIDFKTGQSRDKDRRQVSLYANLMRSMGYDSVEGYLLYTEHGEVEKVV